MARTRMKSRQVTHLLEETGGVIRPLYDKLAETVSVKDFGAVGDGVTDDTAAIQAALDSAIANKTSLYFPATSSYYLCNSTLTISGGGSGQGIKLQGNSTYDSSGYIKTTATVGISIATDMFVEMDNLHIVGATTGNAFDSSQKLIVITNAGNLIANKCWFSSAGTLIDRSATTDTYYTKFFGCRLDTCNTVYDSSITYNLDFIDCRIKAFDTCVKSSSGSGPINFVGGSIEQWTNHVVYQTQANIGLPINVTGTYFENYPSSTAGGSFAKSTFTATSAFYGMSSLSISGCMIYLSGIFRFAYQGIGIIPIITSSGNTFTYTRDASSLQSDTQYVYPPATIGVFNDSINGPAIIEKPAGTDPTLIYDIEYYSGIKSIGYNPFTATTIYKHKTWTNATLVNGYVNSADPNDLPVRYAVQDGKLYLGGVLDISSATDVLCTTTVAFGNADAAFHYTAAVGNNTGESVVIRLLAASGAIRVENLSTLTGTEVYLDGVSFEID